MKDIPIPKQEDITKLYKEVDLVIDWSREETFNRCKKEAYWCYERGLDEKDSGVALQFGDRVHRHIGEGDPSVWDDFTREPSHSRDYRVEWKGRALCETYLFKYGKKDGERFQTIAKEYPFGNIRDVGKWRVLVKGTIDRLLLDKNTGLYYVNEMKTTASYIKDDVFWVPFYMGGQAGYYLYALEHIVGDENVGGVIIDAFYTGRKDTDESDLHRKEIDYEEVLPIEVDEVIREWMARRISDKWRREVNSCRRYNSVCPYYKICRHGENEATLNEFRRKDDNEWHR